MKKKLCATLSALFLLLCWAMPALAAPTIPSEEKETLEVKLAYQKRPLPDVTITLHRVADITEVSPWITFELDGAFEDYNVTLEDLDSNGWADAAFTLANYAGADDIKPDRTAVTDAEGYASFEDLQQGLYLVQAAQYVDADGYRYTVMPALMELPSYDEKEDAWEMEVEAAMKVQRSSPPPTESEESGDGSTFNPGMSLVVRKIWNSGTAEQPESVTVEVVTEGKSVANAQLTAATGWCHTFTGLDSSKQYSVVERDVPRGYSVTIGTSGDAYIITNTAVNCIQPTQAPLVGMIPQTGLLWWPVPVLAVLGVLLFVVGWKKHNDSKGNS